MLHTELFYLGITTLTFIGLLVILLTYLIIRKSFHIKKRQTIEAYKKKYHSIIYKLLINGGYARGLHPQNNAQIKAIEEMLSRYTSVLEGEQEKKNLSEIASFYLKDYYQRRLDSKRWSRRMNVLYHIEDFHMISLLESIDKMAKKRRLSYEETVHVLRILASFQADKMYELLTTDFSNLSEYEYRSILIRLEQKQFDQFVLGYHKLQAALKLALLDVLSIKKDVSYQFFIEKVFLNYSGEIKLRALKALAGIGYVKNIDLYMCLMYSDKWQERMLAAKLIGTLKEEKGIPRLKELLHDQSWWVRHQAGQSISQFSNGKEILTTILETTKDPFAKDMAWEWIHKGV
ncbi:HEAT repeat domain-containing protein [Bacillus xiapuensis]|uniref:HEAT repeat domain-containing protein n=1 Tax=Bacillus xiapuensis TaxID=2014075 RepID=A0ABU6N7G4_9BACI|nr:HEAT repeat domain-containing protein [Bacillus xiapuensis]